MTTPSAPHLPAEFEIPSDEDGAAVREGRHHVRKLAESVLGAGPAAEDAELAAAELITNARDHGSGSIGVVVRGGHGRFMVEVTNDVRSRDDTAPPSIKEPCDFGRGLFIIQELATRGGLAFDEGVVTAWFEIEHP